MNNIPAFLTIDSTVCNILRLTPDVDHEMGSPAGTFEIIASDVVCTLDREQSMSNRFSGGREISLQGATDQATFNLMTLPTTDIQIGDKVTISGVSYDVVDVIPLSSHKEGILNKST